VIEPDVVLAALAARADQTRSELTHDILSRSSAPLARLASASSIDTASPSVDTTFRAADVNDIQVLGDQQPIGNWARALMGVLFAVCSAGAAVAWQHYGDAAKQMIAEFAPPFVLSSSSPPEQPTAAAQPDSPAVQAAATDQPAAQPAAPAQSAPADVAALPAEPTPLLQSMARDLAGMGQQIEQLKASIEQLKAGQQQMSRDMAKNSEIKNSEIKNSEIRNPATGTTEPKPRPRISAISPPPLRAAALPARMPRPVYSPPLAAASTLPPAAAAPVYVPAPPPPVQATAQPDGEPVVRPPMPLR
jgi:hypothetical protein